MGKSKRIAIFFGVSAALTLVFFLFLPMIFTIVFLFTITCNSLIKKLWTAAVASAALSTSLTLAIFQGAFGPNWLWYYNVVVFAVAGAVTAASHPLIRTIITGGSAAQDGEARGSPVA